MVIALLALVTELLIPQTATSNPHRVWREVAAQRVWGEHGAVVKGEFQLGRSVRGRAQLRFWMRQSGSIEGGVVETDRLTIYTVSDGLRAASERAGAVIDGRQAEFVGIWLLPTRQIGYWAADGSARVEWKEGERPPAAGHGHVPSGRVRQVERLRDPFLRVSHLASRHVQIGFTSTAGATTRVVASAFMITAGRDGVHVRSLGSALVTSPERPDGLRTADAELWITEGGAIGLRAEPVR
jgi:hypothetical protein